MRLRPPLRRERLSGGSFLREVFLAAVANPAAGEMGANRRLFEGWLVSGLAEMARHDGPSLVLDAVSETGRKQAGSAMQKGGSRRSMID